MDLFIEITQAVFALGAFVHAVVYWIGAEASEHRMISLLWVIAGLLALK